MDQIPALGVKQTTQSACLGMSKDSKSASPCRAKLIACSERKKSHDKIYPKGYVEMLEQQQGQLVAGLQEMYRRLVNRNCWVGPKLEDVNGHPLTHDILAALHLLESKHDGSGEMEPFEEDFLKLQSKLVADGAGYVRRRGSFSSDSDHSQRGVPKSTTHSTPTFTNPVGFKENFSFSTSPSPLAQSPVSRQRQSYPPLHQSPLHQNCQSVNDPQLYQHEWAMPNRQSLMKSDFAIQTPQLQQNVGDVDDMMDTIDWNDPYPSFDLNMTGVNAYTPQLQSMYGAIPGLQDFPENEADFNRFISVTS